LSDGKTGRDDGKEATDFEEAKDNERAEARDAEPDAE
jgi:hypothetical protein